MFELKKFYLPKHCIQGEEISLFILWKDNNFQKLEIKIPDDWKYGELSNINEDDFSLNDNILLVNKTEMEGFFALSIKTYRYAQPIINETVEIKFNDNDKLIFKNDICLFRPDIKLFNAPNQINVKTDKKYNIKPSEKIIIGNVGRGTAYISVQSNEDSEIELREPPGLLEFITKVWDDIEKKSEKLIGKYPDYSNSIKRFLKLRNLPSTFDDNVINELRAVYNELNDIAVDDDEFHQEFVDIIFSSYIANVNMITFTPADVFVKYINSMQENNIILVNSLDFVQIENNDKFKGKIQVLDKAYNKYEDIPLDFIISGNNLKIPIFSLFDWCVKEER